MAEAIKTTEKPKVSKADVVLRNQREIAARSDKLLNNQMVQYTRLAQNIQAVEDKCDKAISECMYVTRQNTEIFTSLQAENRALKKEMQYLAVQNQKVFEELSALVGKLSTKVDELMAKQPEPAPAQEVNAQIDYDELVDRIVDAIPAQPMADPKEIAKAVVDALPTREDIDAQDIAAAVIASIPLQEVLSPDYIASKTAEQIVIPAMPEMDYNELSTLVAEKIEVPAAEQVDYDRLAVDYDTLAAEVAERIEVPAPQVVEQPAPVQEIDYEKLAAAVVAALPLQEVLSPDYIASKTAEQIVIPATPELDYDALADEVAQRIAVPQATVEAAATEIDYDDLAARISERVTVPTAEATIDEEHLAETIYERVEQALAENEANKAQMPEYDSEDLADKIARKVGSVYSDEFEVLVDEEGCDSIGKAVANKFDYDALASHIYQNLKQAEFSQDTPDYEEIASQIADKITVSANINEDVIADKAAAVLSNYLPEFDTDDVADKVVANVIPAIPPAPVVDTEGICNEIVDRLAEQQENADYDIIIDEEGIDRICDRVTEDVKRTTDERFAKVDNDFDKVADEFDKISQSFDTYNERFDKIAQSFDTYNERFDKIAQAFDNNQEQFEKISQTLAEYNERFDRISQSFAENGEQFDKISQTLAEHNDRFDEITKSFDNSNEQFERISQNLFEHNEQFDKMAQTLAAYNEQFEKISQILADYHERFDKVNEDTAEIKTMLTSGVIHVSADEIAASEAVAEQTATEVPAEDENAEAEEELITVSDIVDEDDEEEAEGEGDNLLDEIVDDIDEQPVMGEMMPDGIPDISNGVDFANMMKYNRSFIARIIQSTDDQKRYYGAVKNAFLSYKKVNSSIAWGAERFNKGRETIAKFKIRGKTLCLYLALDPNEFATSVYHQVDVSDNKSMHGTPMMVKIKSPRGVKKAIRLIDIMLARRDGIKRPVRERDYAAMYPYETIPELIEDGLVKDVSKNK